MSSVCECLAEQLRELQYQGVQATLLIHVHAIVLYMRQYTTENKRASTCRTIGVCRQRKCSRQTIRCSDNKDNKNRENNEIQSTMVTTVMTIIILL